MRAKQLSAFGRLRVGQRVRYSRPDPATIGAGIEHWKYLTGDFHLTAIARCETGALATLSENGEAITAHVCIDASGMDFIPEGSLRVVHEAPRQMEIAA